MHVGQVFVQHGRNCLSREVIFLNAHVSADLLWSGQVCR